MENVYILFLSIESLLSFFERDFMRPKCVDGQDEKRRGDPRDLLFPPFVEELTREREREEREDGWWPRGPNGARIRNRWCR